MGTACVGFKRFIVSKLNNLVICYLNSINCMTKTEGLSRIWDTLTMNLGVGILIIFVSKTNTPIINICYSEWGVSFANITIIMDNERKNVRVTCSTTFNTKTTW